MLPPQRPESYVRLTFLLQQSAGVLATIFQDLLNEYRCFWDGEFVVFSLQVLSGTVDFNRNIRTNFEDQVQHLRQKAG